MQSVAKHSFVIHAALAAFMAGSAAGLLTPNLPEELNSITSRTADWMSTWTLEEEAMQPSAQPLPTLPPPVIIPKRPALPMLKSNRIMVG